MLQPSSDDTGRIPYRSAIAHCRAMLRNGSHTFYAASFLLPRWLRDPASALYAFCRQADDCVDVENGRQRAIDALRERLDLAYRRIPASNPIDHAFAETVHKFGIPRELPEALLAGLEWDAAGRRYDELADLNAYAARVAGTVGAMMGVLMGVRTPSVIARACDLGMAMQLTNIARDVGEDARNGRIYLPLAWFRAEGVDPDRWIEDPRFNPAIARMIGRLLDTADTYYARADAGIRQLPASCRPGIRAARILYAEIGHQLRRDGYDSVTARTIVSSARKMQLLAKVAETARIDAADITAPCIAQAQFLVDSITPVDVREAAARSWWDFNGHAIWVIELFDRLERRERDQSTPAAPVWEGVT